MNKNPFKVGDKVKVKAHVLRTWPRAFKNYIPIQYAVVTKLDSVHVFTDVDSDPTNFEHFELYKESEEDVMKNPHTQQKTKRVPFNPELKDTKVISLSSTPNQPVKDWWVTKDRQIVCQWANGTVGYGQPRWLEMEVLVTTKRIPFNPELKNAKVFYGKTELIEWIRMSSGVVCGIHEHLSPFNSLETALYHPNTLEMEIEEDV